MSVSHPPVFNVSGNERTALVRDVLAPVRLSVSIALVRRPCPYLSAVGLEIGDDVLDV